MSEHIINADKDQHGFYKEGTIDNANQNTKLYTISGRHDFIDQDGFFQVNFEPVEKAKINPYVHAIKHNHRYMVKIGENGKLFNPYGLYSEGMETKQRVGRPTWKFVNTTKANFDQYVIFLKTKNEAFLKKAEREII
jgi:hypothetical protein